MKNRRGFTLIELLVVMAIVSLLLTIAAPRYMRQTEHAKEAALKENLNVLRGVLDQYQGDRGVYPAHLADLVEHGYLRQIPLDPVTDRRDSWLPAFRDSPSGEKQVEDIHSGAPGNGLDGTSYRSW
jgi:general secretion pathway protein G